MNLLVLCIGVWYIYYSCAAFNSGFAVLCFPSAACNVRGKWPPSAHGVGLASGFGNDRNKKYMYGFMLHSRRAVLKSVFPPSALPSSDLHWIDGSAIEDARWLTRHIFARPDIDPDQACHVDRVRNENGCKKLCVVHPMDWADIRASWSEVGGLNITSLTRLHPIPRGTSDNTVLC